MWETEPLYGGIDIDDGAPIETFTIERAGQ